MTLPGGAQSRRTKQKVATSASSAADRSRAAFRQRIDTFFGHPLAAKFRANLGSPSPRPLATAAQVLDDRLGQILTRLGVSTAGPRPADETSGFSLSKSITMHDGRVVAMTGDTAPLGADDDVRVVTTTTSVLDSAGLRSETTVLVFERTAQVVDGGNG